LTKIPHRRGKKKRLVISGEGPGATERGNKKRKTLERE